MEQQCPLSRAFAEVKVILEASIELIFRLE
jgi:hypothetical protein